MIKVQSGGGEHLLQSLCFNHTDVGGGLHILTIGPNCLALPFTQLANAMQCSNVRNYLVRYDQLLQDILEQKKCPKTERGPCLVSGGVGRISNCIARRSRTPDGGLLIIIVMMKSPEIN